MGFRTARKAAGVRLCDAAKKLGVTEQAVCDWETGRKKPRTDKLLAIANLYNCTVDALLRPEEVS